MASNGKKKTTMAKLNRERKLQEKRLDKQARKERRKEGLLNPDTDGELTSWPADDELLDRADFGPEQPQDAVVGDSSGKSA